jgi:hypothetical protein
VDLAALADARTAAVAVDLAGSPPGVSVQRIEPERVAVRPAADAGRE